MTTKIINIFAGPSAGKTTNAINLYGYMKTKRMNVKLALEVADELNWQSPVPQEPGAILDDQIKIFAEQNRRLYSMIDKGLDYIVTDSPILLSAVYLKRGAQKYFKLGRGLWEDSFEDFAMRTFLQYENINYFLQRGDREYIQKGRIQSKEQAQDIDVSCLYFLELYKLRYKQIVGFEDVVKDLEI